MSFKNPEDPLQFLVENYWNKEKKGFNVEINNELQSDLDKMKSNVIKNITKL